MSNRLRECRENKKITQEALSVASGVSRPTISKIEQNDMMTVKVETLIKIADALNEPVAAIFF